MSEPGEVGEQASEQAESELELPAETLEAAAGETWTADLPSSADASTASDAAQPEPVTDPAPEPAADEPAELPELGPELKDAQARHAWERHGATEFSQIGINNAEELHAHIEQVRTSAERAFETRPGVGCYGKSDAGDGAEGTIVIDNPLDLNNGGTAFRNSNVERRTDQLGYTPEDDQ